MQLSWVTKKVQAGNGRHAPCHASGKLGGNSSVQLIRGVRMSPGPSVYQVLPFHVAMKKGRKNFADKQGRAVESIKKGGKNLARAARNVQLNGTIIISYSIVQTYKLCCNVYTQASNVVHRLSQPILNRHIHKYTHRYLIPLYDRHINTPTGPLVPAARRG